MTPAEDYVVALCRSLTDQNVQYWIDWDAAVAYQSSHPDNEYGKRFLKAREHPYYSLFPFPGRVAQLCSIRDSVLRILPSYARFTPRKLDFEVLDVKLKLGETLPSPALGTFAGKQLQCFSKPLQCDDQAIIIFDECFFFVLYELSKIFATCIGQPESTRGNMYAFVGVANPQFMNLRLAYEFLHLSAAASMSAFGGYKKRPLENQAIAGFASEIFYSGIVFALCHELAHVLEEHFIKHDCDTTLFPTPEILTFPHFQELVADFTGLQLAAIHLEGRVGSFHMACLGAEVVLYAVQIADFAARRLEGTSGVSSETHPTASDRKALLRLQCRQSLEEDRGDAAQLIGELMDCATQALMSEGKKKAEAMLGSERAPAGEG